MKKIIFLTVLLFAFSIPCFAQEVSWNMADQATISWDAVTKNESGADIPEGSEITYEVYLIKEGESRDGLAPEDTVSVLQYTFTFTEEGRYLAGLRTIRTIVENGTIIKSTTISWSDNPLVVQSGPFGFVYYEAPASTTGLR